MDNTFGINIIPDNEQQRIEALKRYKILDTPPEHAFDNVARLATQIFKVPISLVSLVGAEEVFFKANIGMGKARVTSRGISLCSLAILKPEVTVFENAPEEPCLLVNPNVAGEFGLKFYAGAPLTTHDGFRIGTLCVIDKTPRKFSKADELILEGLAKIVMDEIELRMAAIEENIKQQEINKDLLCANEELTVTIEELAVSQQHLSETFDILANRVTR
jgi:GAF domain-containing protein